jgi:hypothetical protein
VGQVYLFVEAEALELAALHPIQYFLPRELNRRLFGCLADLQPVHAHHLNPKSSPASKPRRPSTMSLGPTPRLAPTMNLRPKLHWYQAPCPAPKLIPAACLSGLAVAAGAPTGTSTPPMVSPPGLLAITLRPPSGILTSVRSMVTGALFSIGEVAEAVILGSGLCEAY